MILRTTAAATTTTTMSSNLPFGVVAAAAATFEIYKMDLVYMLNFRVSPFSKYNSQLSHYYSKL